jgi:hypothetical protein
MNMIGWFTTDIERRFMGCKSGNTGIAKKSCCAEQVYENFRLLHEEVVTM